MRSMVMMNHDDSLGAGLKICDSSQFDIIRNGFTSYTLSGRR